MFKNLFTKEAPKKMHVIAVASGKGGVGKSTVAVNLAYALKNLGNSVGLLDADIYGPSLPLLLHTTTPISHEENQTKDGKMIPPSYAGVKMLSIGHFGEQLKATVMRGPMVNSLIKQLFTSVAWGQLDYLIIDYPPGTGDVQITLSQIANLAGALLVTTPGEIALSDVRKALHMFELTNTDLLGVVENMSSFICDSCDKEHKIFGTEGGETLAKEFHLELLGKIPMEAKAAQSGDSGKPIVLSDKNCISSKKFEEIAKKIHTKLQNKTSDNLENFSLKWQKA
jgi:ATP-binding protein involved in chromosome partitioning